MRAFHKADPLFIFTSTIIRSFMNGTSMGSRLTSAPIVKEMGKVRISLGKVNAPKMITIANDVATSEIAIFRIIFIIMSPNKAIKNQTH